MKKTQDGIKMDTAPLKLPENGLSAEIDNAYIHAATSDNTRIAYQLDVEHFLKEGGGLPATPQQV